MRIDTEQNTPAHELGRRGEDLAADYLTERGLVVLSRNWRCRDGELDVVATDGSALVVCEVKTRSTDDFGDPAEFVTPVKMRCVRRATHAWLRRYRVGWCEVRFDVVTVLWPVTGEPRLRHLRGAF
jgi:putative endonuclease